MERTESFNNCNKGTTLACFISLYTQFKESLGEGKVSDRVGEEREKAYNLVCGE